MGEEVSETLERVPAHWKVIENVTEKFTCRDCESITQAWLHRIRSRVDVRAPQLLAEVLFGNVRRAPTAQPAERGLRTRGH